MDSNKQKEMSEITSITNDGNCDDTKGVETLEIAEPLVSYSWTEKNLVEIEDEWKRWSDENEFLSIPPVVGTVSSLILKKIAGMIGDKLLKSLFEKLFPTPNPVTILEILEAVQKLLNERLSQEIHQRITLELEGLQQNITNFLEDVEDFEGRIIVDELEDGNQPLAIIDSIHTLNQIFDNRMPQFRNPDYKVLLLPLYAQAANLHISFLKDVVDNASKWGLTASQIKTYTNRFLDKISQYSNYCIETFQRDFQSKFSQKLQDVLKYRNFMTINVLDYGTILNMSGESYFSTILSREYNTNFILFPYTNNSGLIDENLIQNGNLEEQDKYWEGTEPSFFAEGEGTFGSNALKVQAQGAFDQIVKLEPNTTYRLTAFTKVKDSNYSKGRIGIRDMYNYRVEKSFLHTRYKQTKVEFTTGADTSKLSVFIQGGGDQESIAWADNIELYKVHQQDNMISDFDFDTYKYSNMCWKLSGGGDFVEKEGLFNSKALKITNSGGAEQEVKLKANTNYILTAYVKVDVPTTTAQIGCGSNQVPCNSTSYTPVKLKFKTGEDPSTTESSVYCSNSNDSGTVWADNFVLYEAPNLIINGDFEQFDQSSWNFSPSEGGRIYLQSGLGMSRSNAVVLHGQNGQISQKVPLKPFTKYRLTAYVRVSDGGTAWIGYGDYGASCTSKEFKQISKDFTTGANPLQSDDAIYLSSDNSKYTVADNFELYELDQI
ncbi:insecticidal delta-endotoxin Cry8Ea1 family protein [Bacillus thuringiensis]|nr:insecticidal delta-endotoxin Cry8Ea1 family protein [Bacillus thuringiensis]